MVGTEDRAGQQKWDNIQLFSGSDLYVFCFLFLVIFYKFVKGFAKKNAEMQKVYKKVLTQLQIKKVWAKIAIVQWFRRLKQFGGLAIQRKEGCDKH